MNKNQQVSSIRFSHLQLLFLILFCFGAQTCRADCFSDAAAYEHVNPTVLRAISVVESHNNPHAINKNTDGSTDLGLMQINTIHVPELNRYGIHKRDLMQGCKSIYVGAWLLHRSMKRYGNTWKAVGGYHSATPVYRDEYALKVRHAVAQLASHTPFNNQIRYTVASR